MSILKIKNFTIGNNEPMVLMGGVNVLESESVVMAVAEQFAKVTSSLNINWMIKLFDLLMILESKLLHGPI